MEFLSYPVNWFPLARKLKRKIIYHSGPTNSGKTHNALKLFMARSPSVYSSPLRLLAQEVFQKAKDSHVPCDLLTGEAKRYIKEDGKSCGRTACTVEMTNVLKKYDVGILDEIQMMGDLQRGWAWTRVLLGLPAEELHLCGDPSAVDLVERILRATGDEFEVRHYERLSPLRVQERPLVSLGNALPGDCIVCFSKKSVFEVAHSLNSRGVQCSLIYGDMPPVTKRLQAARFNDPDSACKVLVSTDAIGMGLNLNIRRIVFESLKKPTPNQNGELSMRTLTPMQARQIAGRAGRFNSPFPNGFVTAVNEQDCEVISNLLNSPLPPITKGGLQPSFEQLKTFSEKFPNDSFLGLLSRFPEFAKVDNNFFTCDISDLKKKCLLLEKVPLSLKDRFTFCVAPADCDGKFVAKSLIEFASHVSRSKVLSKRKLDRLIEPRYAENHVATSVTALSELEEKYDVLDLYLWLSLRYDELFVNISYIHELRRKFEFVFDSSIDYLTESNQLSGHGNSKSKVTLKIQKKIDQRTQNSWFYEKILENFSLKELVAAEAITQKQAYMISREKHIAKKVIVLSKVLKNNY